MMLWNRRLEIIVSRTPSSRFLVVNLTGSNGYMRRIMVLEGGENPMDTLEVREKRREQIVGAFYNGIGTAFGLTAAGILLAGASKLFGLF